MKNRTIVLLGLALLLGLAANGWSQAGFYVGGFGGVSMQTPSFDTASFGTNSTFLYGLRVGVQVLMFAFEVNYFTAGHNIEMADYFLFNWDGLENDFSFIGGNLRVMFPLAILRPYLALGYGYYTADLLTIDRARDGGFNFGAGLEVKLGKIALIAEGKYHHVRVDLNRLDVGLGDFTLTGGLNIYF
jgi:hypothetical protein